MHTVGPVWNNGIKNKEKSSKIFYLNTLKIASKNKCKTIAFPSMSKGIYQFPKDKVDKNALKTISFFLEKNNYIGKVILVSFDDDN